MVEAHHAQRLRIRPWRRSTWRRSRAIPALGGAPGIVMGSIPSARLPCGKHYRLAMGTYGVAGLPAAGAPPDVPQPRNAKGAGAAGALPSVGALSRGFRPYQI